ncbi:MAG: hypothetical protein MJE66_16470 [Proteobacteria bacterium]|nr:hypothetical protein [Pseudomonadota bacterium]
MLNWIAVLTFTGLTLFAAARLLGLWLETRKLPELLIAILILGVGTIAVGAGFIVRSLVPETWLPVSNFLSPIGAAGGMTALCIFTWRVYHPTSRVAAGVACLLSGTLAALLGYAVFMGSVEALNERPMLSLLNSLIYVGVMLWSATEALLYWFPMRRRLALGLADPLVVNRVLLWGLATGTAGVGIGIGVLARYLGDVVNPDGSWVTLSYAVHGMFSAIGFWLAFKPPAVYVRWVRTRAERSA